MCTRTVTSSRFLLKMSFVKIPWMIENQGEIALKNILCCKCCNDAATSRVPSSECNNSESSPRAEQWKNKKQAQQGVVGFKIPPSVCMWAARSYVHYFIKSINVAALQKPWIVGHTLLHWDAKNKLVWAAKWKFTPTYDATIKHGNWSSMLMFVCWKSLWMEIGLRALIVFPPLLYR